MNDKEASLYIEAVLLANSEAETHADWPTDILVVLRRIAFRLFIEGTEYAKNHP